MSQYDYRMMEARANELNTSFSTEAYEEAKMPDYRLQNMFFSVEDAKTRCMSGFKRKLYPVRDSVLVQPKYWDDVNTYKDFLAPPVNPPLPPLLSQPSPRAYFPPDPLPPPPLFQKAINAVSGLGADIKNWDRLPSDNKLLYVCSKDDNAVFVLLMLLAVVLSISCLVFIGQLGAFVFKHHRRFSTGS